MKKLYLHIFYVGLIIILTPSCTKLAYLKNAEHISREQLKNTAGLYDAKIMPKDILSIVVSSETPGAASDFNLSYPVSTRVGSSSQEFSQSSNFSNYIVDSEGYINFPILGKLKLAGLTKKQAESLIFSLIYPNYLTEKPIIDIRFLSYTITVLGEVAKPGIYKVENEQMTVFDALAVAGDLTIYGKRDNVMLLRTKEDGEIYIKRINLQDKNLLFNKEVFYLQQNDKIFVETNRAKGNSRYLGSVEMVGLSMLSLLVSIVGIIISSNK